MKNILLILFVTAFACLSAQEIPHIHYLTDPEAAERQHSIDVSDMKVEVSFEPAAGKVIGKVTHKFRTIQNGIDTLFFDAPAINIISAELDNQKVNFTLNPEGVVLRFSKSLNWDEQHTVVFNYTATPKKGIYFIGWNQPENTGKADINYIRKQIWTQGQGIDNRYWIPMYDCMNDKFITETIITIESKYKVLSNGKNISSKDNGNGTSTWHYAMEKPHAGYLLMLAIGNYEVRNSVTKRGTPVQFWYYPEFKDRVEYTCRHTEKMIELLEDETGTPYPWGAYSQIMVQNFLYGAMENTSATIFGDFFTTDARGFKDRNYMGVNCHELTHQWFGDLITARSNNDVWLQESFATFYPKLFFRSIEGDEAYQWGLRSEYNSALAQSLKDNYPVRHTKGGTVRLYPKGSAVLSMLRYQLGEENFKRFIQHYLSVHGFKNVEAWDFQKALKDKLGLNYDWFFEQWIHRGGEPHYKVSYKKEDNGINVKVKQLHKVDGHVTYFKMPVDFAVYYKDGTVDRKTVWVMDLEEQTIVLPIKQGSEIDFVLFDEESKVMKKMEFKKSSAELFAQAKRAVHMIDRYDAIVGLKEVSFNEKSTFLLARYKEEKHFGIRAEIARQLANQQMKTWYLELINDPKSEVKLAFISASKPSEINNPVFEKLLMDSSYVVVENAMDKLMNNKKITPAEKTRMLALIQDISGQNNNVRVKWLEYTIQYNPAMKAAAETELINLCGSVYEFRTRVNAANALRRIDLFNATVANNLIDAVLTYNSRLAGPSADVLRTFMKDSDHKATIESEINKLSEEKKKMMRRILNIES